MTEDGGCAFVVTEYAGLVAEALELELHVAAGLTATVQTRVVLAECGCLDACPTADVVTGAGHFDELAGVYRLALTSSAAGRFKVCVAATGTPPAFSQEQSAKQGKEIPTRPKAHTSSIPRSPRLIG